jgi:hypothetical protein
MSPTECHTLQPEKITACITIVVPTLISTETFQKINPRLIAGSVEMSKNKKSEQSDER